MSCARTRWKKDQRKILMLLAAARPPNWKVTRTTLPRYTSSSQWRRNRPTKATRTIARCKTAPDDASPDPATTAAATQSQTATRSASGAATPLSPPRDVPAYPDEERQDRDDHKRAQENGDAHRLPPTNVRELRATWPTNPAHFAREPTRYGLTTHARPSGCLPAATRPITDSDFTSMTATSSSGVQATYARAPSGCITIPAAPCPIGTRFITARVAERSTVTSGPRSVETNASDPSGVNLSRFAPRTSTASVCTTCFVATSMTEIVPSWAFATHASLPSGDTSKPSGPLPTGTTVSSQSSRGTGLAPPGGPGGGPPGPGPRRWPLLGSMMVTVPELTFVVMMCFMSAETKSIWVRFCPVPSTQSTFCVDRS